MHAEEYYTILENMIQRSSRRACIHNVDVIKTNFITYCGHLL